MDFIQDSFNFLFLLFIYIPLNILFMFLAAFVLGILNKLMGLNFPTWVVAFASAILIFVMLFSLLETSTWSNHSDGTIFYAVSIVINTCVAALMLTFSGIGRLIFKKKIIIAFSFNKPQKLATIIYCSTLGLLIAIPLLSQTNKYIADVVDEKYKSNLKQVIETNNVAAFEKSLEKNYKLAEVRLDYTTQSVFEYLLVRNKVELVKVLVKQKRELLGYSFDWEINSPEMMQALIEAGMPAVEAVEKLTYHNKTALVKLVVEKYHPQFDSGNNLMVSYIARNVLDFNHNPLLLDYLVKNGLAKGLIQTNEAIYYFIKKNDIETVKMLSGKGFQIDTAQYGMMETAITNENLDMIRFLFQHKFSIHKSFNDYTYVENAIISNSDSVIDLLLSLKPDITTLHPTFSDGETNALLLAEKYKRSSTLEKLKKHIASK